MSAVITDIGGAAGCAWCGLLIPLATFTAHSSQCERAIMAGQRSLFGGARGLFDSLAEGEPSLAEQAKTEGIALLASMGQGRTVRR